MAPVTRMGDENIIQNAEYRIWFRKYVGKERLRKLGVDERKILNWILKKYYRKG